MTQVDMLNYEYDENGEYYIKEKRHSKRKLKKPKTKKNKTVSPKYRFSRSDRYSAKNDIEEQLMYSEY